MIYEGDNSSILFLKYGTKMGSVVFDKLLATHFQNCLI